MYDFLCFVRGVSQAGSDGGWRFWGNQDDKGNRWIQAVSLLRASSSLDCSHLRHVNRSPMDTEARLRGDSGACQPFAIYYTIPPI